MSKINSTLKIILYFLPAVSLMILIFFMSHQTGEESSQLSTSLVLQIFNTSSTSTIELTSLSYLIRKGAHMAEYCLLFLLLYYGFFRCKFSHPTSTKRSIIIAFLYACSDEIHQLFIPDRAGTISDVFIDSIGIIVGFILILFIHKFLLKTH